MAQDNDKALLRRRKVQGTWLARVDRRSKGWSMPGLPSLREHEREQTLADFVGEERAPSVFASLRPAFKDAGKLASSIVGNLDLKSDALLKELARNWTCIMGADNARQCRPLSVENGALSIEVFSASWLFALNCNKPLITRHVFEITSGAVKRVFLVQQGASKKK